MHPDAGGADPMRLEPPAGWERIATGVWRRVVYRPSEDAAYLYTLLGGGGAESRARSVAGAGAAGPDPPGAAALVPPGFGPERLVFFDAETTGLSSGAGTSVFLVGFARIGPQGVTTEQLFMADYPAEAEFLRAVATRIGEDDLAVSYNGKGFDTHVLGTRFLLNGARPPIGAQLDLLYTTRRLWRRSLGQCSLGMVEEGVLGVRRDRDLPSAEVPERYFEFLRSGDPAGLEDAFAHHLQDIESLVFLLARIERVFADPTAETATKGPADGRRNGGRRDGGRRAERGRDAARRANGSGRPFPARPHAPAARSSRGRAYPSAGRAGGDFDERRDACRSSARAALPRGWTYRSGR